MLKAELSGQTVNKAEHNRGLQERLNARSKGSIEFKHANISAALLALGDLPYIDGYKPRSNYQSLLEQVILERLTIEPDFLDRAAAGPVVQPRDAPATQFADLTGLEVEPPEPVEDPGLGQPTFARADAGSRIVLLKDLRAPAAPPRRTDRPSSRR